MALIVWERQMTNHMERERLMDINVLTGEGGSPKDVWGNQGRLLRGGDISAGP